MFDQSRKTGKDSRQLSLLCRALPRSIAKGRDAAMSWQLPLAISNWSLPRQKLAALPFFVVWYMPSSMPVICNEDFFTFNDSRIAWILTLQESIWSGPGASQGQVFVRSLWDFESTVHLWIPALTWTSLRFLISMFLIWNCRICLLQGLHWGRLFVLWKRLRASMWFHASASVKVKRKRKGKARSKNELSGCLMSGRWWDWSFQEFVIDPIYTTLLERLPFDVCMFYPLAEFAHSSYMTILLGTNWISLCSLCSNMLLDRWWIHR